MLSDSQKHLASAILTRSVVVGFHMRSEGACRILVCTPVCRISAAATVLFPNYRRQR